MAGTTAGGQKAAKALKLHYGKDYFHRLGKLGGNPVLIEQGKRKNDNRD